MQCVTDAKTNCKAFLALSFHGNRQFQSTKDKSEGAHACRISSLPPAEFRYPIWRGSALLLFRTRRLAMPREDNPEHHSTLFCIFKMSIWEWMRHLYKKMTQYLHGLLIVVLMLTVVSCGDDDKKDEPNDPSQEALIGAWQVTSSEDPSFWGNCIFDFRENGRLTITFNPDEKYEENVPCRYKLTGTKLKIDFGYGDEVYEGILKIKGDILTFDMISYDPEDPEDVEEDFLTMRRVK